MAKPILAVSSNGKPMHYSVGAIIKRNGKFMLINRVRPPLGFANVSGHIDEGEEPEQALKREVREEISLDISEFKLLFKGELDIVDCRHRVRLHYWYLYECEVEGTPKVDPKEAKSVGWYSKEEIKELKLSPVHTHWFKKLGVL